eukprot:6206341-Pleurochrysis_carterae.AAC.4
MRPGRSSLRRHRTSGTLGRRRQASRRAAASRRGTKHATRRGADPCPSLQTATSQSRESRCSSGRAARAST